MGVVLHGIAKDIKSTAHTKLALEALYNSKLGTNMVVTIAVWITVLFCTYSCGIYAASTSGSTYTEPVCAPDGFYCPTTTLTFSTHKCLPREMRCAGASSAEECTRKTNSDCKYDSTSGKFEVCKHSTPLQNLPSKRNIIGNPVDCLGRSREHQFITYRGLMFEFGNYGAGVRARVQDPNDPKYEYRSGNRKIKNTLWVGQSRCSYEDVMKVVGVWNNAKYQLCSNNCQDFAAGLANILTNDVDCNQLRAEMAKSNDDLAKYIKQASNLCSGAYTSLPFSVVTLCWTLIVAGALSVM